VPHDYNVISKYASNFYANLYKVESHNQSSNIINLLKDVTKVSGDFSFFDEKLSIVEVKWGIENLNLNKAPGKRWSNLWL